MKKSLPAKKNYLFFRINKELYHLTAQIHVFYLQRFTGCIRPLHNLLWPAIRFLLSFYFKRSSAIFLKVVTETFVELLNWITHCWTGLFYLTCSGTRNHFNRRKFSCPTWSRGSRLYTKRIIFLCKTSSFFLYLAARPVYHDEQQQSK